MSWSSCLNKDTHPRVQNICYRVCGLVQVSIWLLDDLKDQLMDIYFIG